MAVSRVNTGTDLELGTWTVTEDAVRQYLEAVGDTQPAYFDCKLAPPVALAAWTLGALLKKLALPSGAIHSLQELESCGGVHFGEEVRATAYPGRPRRRGNLEFLTTGYTLRNRNGEQLLTGKSTVLIVSPSEEEAAGEGSLQTSAAPPGNSGISTADGKRPQSSLPVITRTITQSQLNDYSQASGDDNPLHLDPAFAASTQFGGIIAHGMLTLAFVGEMMVAAYGRSWLETGLLNAKFRGAAHLGDRLETWGQVAREEARPNGRSVECSVNVRNSRSGEEIINGAAAVLIKPPRPSL
ncbi:MAG: MaoC family dehydratase N-terminal domain-containing protein [Chloroflexi bacterium]|nr:MaoC family dehydratase N-terminal domain-containing protein [Chloroflexota bacterium]